MSLIKDYKGPKRYELFIVTLEVLDKLGGSGRINEIHEKVIDFLFSPLKCIILIKFANPSGEHFLR